MRTLFQFLYRSRIFLLFIALEALAFVWMYHSRSYQRSVMLHSANQVTGRLLESTHSLTHFLQLGVQNERLARENARLRSLQTENYLPLYRSPARDTADTTYQVRYRYQEARVVSSSHRKARNYMTINRGRHHGLEPGMGVVGSDGIVGIVNEVSQHFATVIPLINPSFRASGKLGETGYFGPVQWSTNDHRYAYLTDIPHYANVNPGDSVFTDSRSQIFPEGVPIGTVEDYNLQDDQNFYRIKLRLATNFAALHYVYVVEDLLQDELEQLENITP